MTISVPSRLYMPSCSRHASDTHTPRWPCREWASPYFPPRALSDHPSRNAYQVYTKYILFGITCLEKKKSPEAVLPRKCDQRLTHLPPPDTDSCLFCTARAPVRLGRGSGARMFSVFGRSHVCSEIEQILFSTHDIIPAAAHCRTHGIVSFSSMILHFTEICAGRRPLAVSYTHLTLPTIYSV